MAADRCYNHQSREVEFTVMVRTTTGRSVYRLCAECGARYDGAVRVRPADVTLNRPTPDAVDQDLLAQWVSPTLARGAAR